MGKAGLFSERCTRLYNVSYGSLWNRVKSRHNNTVGHPVTLNANDELNVAETIKALSSWNMHLSKFEVRIVQSYPDKSGQGK